MTLNEGGADPESSRLILQPNDDGFRSEFKNYNQGQQKYLSINLSDLKLRMRDFKSAVKSSDIVSPLIGVIGMWTPVFTSDFHHFAGLSPDMVKGVYSTVAFLMSMILLRNLAMCLRTKAYQFLQKRASHERFMKYETDPDALADMLMYVTSSPAKKSKKKRRQQGILGAIFSEMASVIRNL